MYESCLKELLSSCRSCHEQCRVIIKSRLGTFVRMLSSCEACGMEYSWGSQPLTSRLPAGNLEVAGSILFTGASASKALQLFSNMNIMCISERTFRNIQCSYLIPAVRNVWMEYQTAALQLCEGRDVKVGGDARCCSPGHSAKYGSYSLMDLESGMILAVELVQVTETENSYRMEIEGLKRCLQNLKDRNIRITDLTTDRHVQVKSYMAKEETSIRHWFDVWHVAKGIFKKLQLLSKKKGCEQIKDWCHSISNHLYWAAATSDGDGDLVEEKWLSILNHVCDVHEGHGDRFQACEHPPLAERSWITKGSKADKELQLIVGNKRLVKDVRKLSPAQQTSQLEAYHKTVCHFAPKFHHFFYDAMNARVLLAAIHQNENTERRQAITKGGDLRWKVAYPKAKKGDHTLKAVLDTCSYEYVDRLMEEIFGLRRRYPSYKVAQETFRQECPPPMAAFGNRVDKGEAVRRYRTRFNR